MTEQPVRPLPVWPFPLRDEHRELLKQAKAAMDVPYRVQPVKPEPGMPGRVLCFGELPTTLNPAGETVEFLCEAIFIAPENTTSYESVLGALNELLHAPEGEARSFDEAQQLAALLPGTVEITDPVEISLLEQLREDRAMRRAMMAGIP